jgi:hypothetical protein
MLYVFPESHSWVVVVLLKARIASKTGRQAISNLRPKFIELNLGEWLIT